MLSIMLSFCDIIVFLKVLLCAGLFFMPYFIIECSFVLFEPWA